MERECKHCGKVIKYDKPQQFGGHLSNCNLNPANKQRLEKIKLTKSKKLISFIFSCKKCNKEYELRMTEKAYSKEKYTKYCCQSCANSHIKTEESKLKSSVTMKNSEKAKLANQKRRGVKGRTQTQDVKDKIRESIKSYYLNNPDRKINHKKAERCKICGDLTESCFQLSICRKPQLFSTLVKHFGFNQELIGTSSVHEEYERIRKDLYKDYWEDNLSMEEIGNKYNHISKGVERISNIFKVFGIKKRSLSESVKNSIITGRSVIAPFSCSCYKSGYHTTWDNKKFWLRSSYELDYAKELDSKKITYEVESIRIYYFDSIKNKQRVAVPDFYLPVTNTIVEIKGSYFYSEQNIKDKFKAYEEAGYKTLLIYEHKEKTL